jgi:hypothetical protein
MGRTGRPRFDHVAWLFALIVAVIPLWVVRELPLVDLPQHSYVLAVLGHPDDPATLYPRYFEARPGFRPYLGYYAVAGLFGRVMPIDTRTGSSSPSSSPRSPWRSRSCCAAWAARHGPGS